MFRRNGLSLVALVLLRVCALTTAQSPNSQLPSFSLVISTVSQASETRGGLSTTTNPSATATRSGPTIIGSPGTPTSDSTTPTPTDDSSSSSVPESTSSPASSSSSSTSSSPSSSSSSSSTSASPTSTSPNAAMNIRLNSSPIALAAMAAGLAGAVAMLVI